MVDANQKRRPAFGDITNVRELVHKVVAPVYDMYGFMYDKSFKLMFDDCTVNKLALILQCVHCSTSNLYL